MPLTRIFARASERTKTYPMSAHYFGAAGCALSGLAARFAMTPVFPDGYPYIMFFFGINLSAALFRPPAGIVTTLLSALLAVYFYVPPYYTFRLPDLETLVGLGLFVCIGCLNTKIIETLHRSLEELNETKRKHLLLIKEYRHRTRNDLQSLVGMLLLRARMSKNEASKEGLREAAGHAMSLARVHTRLEQAEVASGSHATTDTRRFLCGLCDDLHKAFNTDGLRLIAFETEIEEHTITTERAVHVGLVLNEIVTNAVKYAFPDEREGHIKILFCRIGDDFILRVVDNGVGMPPMDDGSRGKQTSGLGTRLLQALAAQLRGSFRREIGHGGEGTVAELRFPVATVHNVYAH